MVKIICEGGDDHSFLKLILNDLQANKKLSENIIDFASYIKPMGGKSKLLDSSKYKLLNKQIGTKIKKVIFVFDCDFEDDDKNCGNFENSKKCIEKLIQELNWNIEIDYYIFNKNLDYFIIETLEQSENFLSCEKCFELKKLNKNRKILTCIYQKLYPKKPYDFLHPNFNKLKDKLINLFKE
jgi:hypothetical protein